jgi:hypothetical protein
MTYHDDFDDRPRPTHSPRPHGFSGRPRRDEPVDSGAEYRRPSVGGLTSGGPGAGVPFAGYGPPGYAPVSHTDFHGGEYFMGSYPRPFAGTFPPTGDFLGAGGMVISGIESGATLPTPGGHQHRYADRWPSHQRGSESSDAGSGRFAGRGPRNYRRSNERIAEDVNERLAWHSELDAEGIEVNVEDGLVTLSGQVESRFDKRLAEEIAESCAGVIDVRNRLKVRRLPHSADRQDR